MNGENINDEYLRCIACDSPHIEYFASTKDYHYGNDGEWATYKCTTCGLIMQYPIPSNEYLSKCYPMHYYSFNEVKIDLKPSLLKHKGLLLRVAFLKNQRGYKHLKITDYRLFSSLYKNFLSKPLYIDDPIFINAGNYLDYGCGANGTVGLMRYLGWNAEGIEIDKSAVDIARSNNLEIRQGSNEALDGYNNYYDYIFSSHAIEHVNDPITLFEKFYKSLKKGGILAFEVPNGNSAAIDIYHDLFYYFCMPVHINIFTFDSLKYILKKSGFRNLQFATYSKWNTQIASYYLSKKVKIGIHDKLDNISRTKKIFGRFRTFKTYLKSKEKLKGDNLIIKCKK